jgi:hypothetical protein
MRTAQSFLKEGMEEYIHSTKWDMTDFIVRAMKEYANQCVEEDRLRLFEACEKETYYTDSGKATGFNSDQEHSMKSIFNTLDIVTP